MRHNQTEQGDGYSHQPVLWREILGYVNDSPKAGRGLLVDATLGEGGHSEMLLKNFPELTIMAFERDHHILAVAKERLAVFGQRISFVNDNFSSLARYRASEGGGVDYMLFDFGISSFHYEKSGRGFSFARDEKLDMRLDDRAERDASDIVNTCRESELAEIFFRYGQERWSRRIASAICRQRQEASIETTSRLAEVVLRAIPRRYHVKNIHPATRVFQALRIAVNNELAAIDSVMRQFPPLLAQGGRLMAISFHSL